MKCAVDAVNVVPTTVACVLLKRIFETMKGEALYGERAHETRGRGAATEKAE